MKKALVAYLLVLACTLGLVFYANTYQSRISLKTPNTWDGTKFAYQNGLMTYLDDHVETKTGIDVSEHQGQIDWEKLSQTPVEFVYIRIGYSSIKDGTIYEDPFWRQNYEQARLNGLSIGVYYYSTAITLDEAKKEANQVNEWLIGHSLDLPVGFDMEPYTTGSRIDQLSKQEATSIAKTFINTLHQKAILYGNQTWLTQRIDISQLAEVPIWYAQYNSAPDYTRFNLWQYSSTGLLPGISTHVDMNILLMEKEKND